MRNVRYNRRRRKLAFKIELFRQKIASIIVPIEDHQIFELTDGVYQACRVSFGSKSHLWENFRATIRMLVVDDWAHLMDLLLNPDNYEVTATKNS